MVGVSEGDECRVVQVADDAQSGGEESNERCGEQMRGVW
jgi:hypothetical protein